MKTYGNEITIHRGESFTIDKFIVNKDGSPFIVSKELENPHFRLSVSDSLYEQNDRYLINYFMSLKNLPRFVCTQPVDIRSFRGSPNGNILYQSFESMSGLPSGYVGDSLVTYNEGDEAVFFNKLSDNSIEYKYFTDGGWKDYSFRLVKSFASAVTSEWKSQNYWYDITLVSGPIKDGSFVRFDTQLPILNPTRLTVLSDL